MKKEEIFTDCDLGGSHLIDEIEDYEIIYYENNEKDRQGNRIDEIKIKFKSGIILTVDGGFLPYIKYAKRKRNVIDIHYSISMRNDSWEDEKEEEK